MIYCHSSYHDWDENCQVSWWPHHTEVATLHNPHISVANLLVLWWTLTRNLGVSHNRHPDNIKILNFGLFYIQSVKQMLLFLENKNLTPCFKFPNFCLTQLFIEKQNSKTKIFLSNLMQQGWSKQNIHPVDMFPTCEDTRNYYQYEHLQEGTLNINVICNIIVWFIPISWYNSRWKSVIQSVWKTPMMRNTMTQG